MNLTPFRKVSDVPTGQDNLFDLVFDMDFIDVSAACILKHVHGIKEDYHTGLTAYMFDGQIKFGFPANYKIESIEFRKPFDLPDVKGLFYKDTNLFQPTQNDVKKALESQGVVIQDADYGFEAPEIGIAFFSSYFEDDFDIELDAVTVFFK